MSLTSADRFEKLTDLELAYWLMNEAQKLDGVAGYNNTVASLRQAALRLGYDEQHSR